MGRHQHSGKLPAKLSGPEQQRENMRTGLGAFFSSRAPAQADTSRGPVGEAGAAAHEGVAGEERAGGAVAEGERARTPLKRSA